MKIWFEFNTKFKKYTSEKEAALEFVNSCRNGDIHLRWTGTLAELETSSEYVSMTIREWFYESEKSIGPEQRGKIKSAIDIAQEYHKT